MEVVSPYRDLAHSLPFVRVHDLWSSRSLFLCFPALGMFEPLSLISTLLTFFVTIDNKVLPNARYGSDSISRPLVAVKVYPSAA